jgi:hypothetical protein
MIGNIEPLITAVFAGVLYSLIWWSAKNIDPTKPSPLFDWYSLGATALVGAFVGLSAMLSGNPFSQMGIEMQLAASGAIIAVIEKVLKTLYRWISAKFPEQIIEVY